MTAEKILDGNGVELTEGDRVRTYDFDGSWCYGKLLYDLRGHWYVLYEDGEEFVVLDFDQIFFVPQEGKLF